MAIHFITALYGAQIGAASTPQRLRRAVAKAAGLYLRDNVLVSEPTVESALRTVVEAEGLDLVGALLPPRGLAGYLAGNRLLPEEIRKRTGRELYMASVPDALAAAIAREGLEVRPVKAETVEGIRPVPGHLLFYTRPEAFMDYLADRLRTDGTGQGYVLSDADEVV